MLNEIVQRCIDFTQSKYRNYKYKEGVYFTPSPGEDTTQLMRIELLKGPFKGIIYSYGDINFLEDLGHRGSQASFDITILNNDLTEKQKDKYITDTKFCKIVGQILLVIIEKALEMQVQKYYSENLNEEDREDYFEEPVPERTVRKKGSPVSESRVSSGEIREDSI
jgi:hypothetical protein